MDDDDFYDFLKTQGYTNPRSEIINYINLYNEEANDKIYLSEQDSLRDLYNLSTIKQKSDRSILGFDLE